MEVLLNCLTQLKIRTVKFADDDFFFTLFLFLYSTRRNVEGVTTSKV